MSFSESTLGLYVHIPFCLTRCAYCDFFTKPLPDQFPRSETFGPLLEAIQKELKEQAPAFSKKKIRTIFFGGGTPSLLEPHELEELLKSISHHFEPEGSWKDVEITLEVNPETMTKSKAQIFKQIGVNRISMGVQSLDEASLRSLGRKHTVSNAKNCYELLREVGYTNINLDFIYGRPNQTLSLWEEELDEILRLDPDHLSLYELILEPGTPMTLAVKRGELSLPSEEEVLEMYRFARIKTYEGGMEWYEVSNYAKPGYRSLHNLDNWRGSEYLGIGPGAHSFSWFSEHGSRRANPRNMPMYLDRPGSALWKMREEKDACFESLLNGFRLLEGFRITALKSRYETFFHFLRREKLPYLIEQDYLVCEQDVWRLTPRGLELLDSILLYLEADWPV